MGVTGYVFCQQKALLPTSSHHPVIIAHRGDHSRVPENTLAAYEAAIASGADYVEVDLRTTRDGHLVILHDEDVYRMTGNQGEVKDLTYDQIRKMTIKPRDKNDTGVYHIPDFASVLKLCRGRINIYLDFKAADVALAYKQIKAAGMQKQVIVYLNNRDQYGSWRKVAPKIPLMASIPEKGGLRALKRLSPDKRINLVDNAYDERTINQLHQMNIYVWLDVESDDEGPARWQHALDVGADGLQTDHPDALIDYLRQKRN